MPSGAMHCVPSGVCSQQSAALSAALPLSRSPALPLSAVRLSTGLASSRLLTARVLGVSPQLEPSARARSARRLPDRALELAAASKGAVSLLEAEVAVGLADLALAVVDHPILTRPYVYETLRRERVLPHATALARLFLNRFDPSTTFGDFALDTALQEASQRREQSLETEPTRILVIATDCH